LGRFGLSDRVAAVTGASEGIGRDIALGLAGAGARIPLGRFAAAEDLVGAAIYLSSPASDFVTGHTLFVDGGWVAGS
jgi:NAD(P)-dependent dehydrogenase (short-subunit alcohol dehydrogenase family)